MLVKHKANQNEFAFTLIELLVVIVVIAVLASIAIPAFINQRQRANDSAVESDVRYAINIVEYYQGAIANTTKTSSPSASIVSSSLAEIELSPGVHLAVHKGGAYYCITAYHENGKKYTSRTQALTYKNIDSGGGWESGCVNIPLESSFKVGK